MENRIVELETKIAYLEDMLQQLNEVVTTQANTIDQLQEAFKGMEEVMKDYLLETSESKTEDPPPHY